jgi:multidrug resistance efflux pump
MKRGLITLLVVVTLVVGAVSFFLFAKRVKNSGSIRTTGIVEGVEVNISTMVPGTIVKECCKEGEIVREGEIIIELESDDFRASVAQALAGVEKATAEVSVSESAIEAAKANISSAKADIKTAEADVKRARVQMKETQRHMDRSRILYERKVISKESLETAVANYDTAAANYNASKARLAAALSKRGSVAAQLKTAEGQLDSAKANLRQSKATLSYNRAKLAETILRSPISGTIVFKALEKGELVSPGMTIMTLVDLSNLYVRVDVEETMVGNIALNSDAMIKTTGPPDRIIKGKISEIGRYAEFATQRDVIRGRQDIKTFKVKITVENREGFLKPGMTVEVEIPKG